MLTPEEKSEIEHELQHHFRKQGAGPEALKIIQRHRGWVPDDCLEEVAALLEMTPADLDGVATFYNRIYRKPVGKHVIILCDSVTCWIMGHRGICRHLQSRLGIGMGETSPDGRFTLLPNACLGACDHAPAMMVGNRLHLNLDPAKVDSIVDEILREESRG